MADEKHYICPGETQPISRSVHLARLAAFYPTCLDCALRCDTGSISQRVIERLERAGLKSQQSLEVTENGVRGVWRNVLDRNRAAALARVFATRMQTARPGRTARRQSSIENSLPTMIVGHDERDASPDLFAGITRAVRQSGWDVVDIGQATPACLRFAISHLGARAGTLVTGAGLPPAWTGLSFFAGDMICPPISEIVLASEQPTPRPARSAGRLTTFRAGLPFEAGLLRHFHSVEPVKLAVGSPSSLVLGMIERVTSEAGMTTSTIRLPTRNTTEPNHLHAADIDRMADYASGEPDRFAFLVSEDADQVYRVNRLADVTQLPCEGNAISGIANFLREIQLSALGDSRSS